MKDELKGPAARTLVFDGSVRFTCLSVINRDIYWSASDIIAHLVELEHVAAANGLGLREDEPCDITDLSGAPRAAFDDRAIFAVGLAVWLGKVDDCSLGVIIARCGTWRTLGHGRLTKAHDSFFFVFPTRFIVVHKLDRTRAA